MTNYYETLGLRTTASQKEIKDAYQKLSQKFHPDNNDGDQYFSDLFRNIREAYVVLSDEKKKMEYDNRKDSRETGPEEEKKSTEPKIVFFQSNKETFVEGDTIELSWETHNTDKVFIKPFGELRAKDRKIFKLKNFNKPELKIKLEAINSDSDKKITEAIILRNEIVEVDFSDFDESNEDINKPIDESFAQINDESEPVATGYLGEQVYGNSFVVTESVQKEDSEVVNEIEESFFSSRGRLRRSSYILRSILLSLPTWVLYIYNESSFNSYSNHNDNTLIFSGLVMIAIGYFWLLQYVKRLHDINLSGWFSLINLIPYVGALFGLIVVFIDSSRGENKYGPDPKNRS